MKIAHLSDCHFAKPTYNWRQFLSKRWLGNFNLILFRSHRYQTEHLWELPSLLKSYGVKCTFITGDFATTSRDEEFDEGKYFVSLFPPPVIVVPGNHDAYTKESEKSRRFYQYFLDEDMKRDRVSSKEVGEGWWSISLDCAKATSVLYSNGEFFPSMQKSLEKKLSEIPSNAHIIVANHFPLFRSGRPRHDLVGIESLQSMMRQDTRIKLYLHGHEHRPYIVEKKDYPLVLNSGSSAYFPNGTFYLVDLEKHGCWVQQGKIGKQGTELLWALSEKRWYLFR